MKPDQIKVGDTYINKDAGRTRRRVLEIGEHVTAPWYSRKSRKDLRNVRYEQRGKEGRLALEVFAKWAGEPSH